MNDRIIILFAAAIPLGIVIALVAAQAWQAQRRVNQVRRWKATSGRIVQSRVRQATARVLRSIPIYQHRTAIRYVPHIVYEYRVDTAVYRASRREMGPVWYASDPAGAEKIVARYPVGKAVMVYYDPDDPIQAVLNPGGGAGLRFLWIVTLILVILLGVIAGLILSP
jgi:hypothetical protein